VLCIAIAQTQGCGRPGIFRQADADTTSSTDAQNLPFHQGADQPPDDSARPNIPTDGKSELGTSLPRLAHTRFLPAGTLITVQLENSLTISRIHAGDVFNASVAGPVAAQGEVLISRGTLAAGDVESARPSASRVGFGVDSGYAQLVLTSLNVGGKSVPIQTSSLFAKGTLPATAGEESPESARFQLAKGRRLTFRLTAPLTLHDQSAIASR
jgi:hypothetical protein